MADLYGDLRLRPTRIGFLVNPTDRVSVRKIMRYCACLWGGQYNPIIPVSKRRPKIWRENSHDRATGLQIAEGYLRFFEPDVLVEASPGLAKRLGYQKGDSTGLYKHVISLSDFTKGQAPGRPELEFGLNAFDIYRHLYATEYQFVQRNERPFAFFESSRQNQAFFEAAFGVFPEERRLQYIKKGYIDTFKPTKMSTTYESVNKIYTEKIITPFQVNRKDIKLDYYDRNHPVIFIVDQRKTTDLIDLWNIRQFKNDVLPIEVGSLPGTHEFIKEFILKNHRPLPNNPHGIMIRTTLEFARSISEDCAKEIKKLFFSDLPDGSYISKNWYTDIWHHYTDEDMALRPSKVRLTAATSTLTLPVSEEDQSIRFETLYPEFAEEYGNSARWANVLTLDSYGAQPDLALVFPSNHKDLNFPRLGVGDPIIVSREGFIMLQESKKLGGYLKLENGTDAIMGWLKHRGIPASQSDAGRTTDQIIISAGRLHNMGFFADAETLQTLNKMAASENKTESVEQWKGIIQRCKNKRRMRRIELKDFTRANILRLGLTVRCSHCQKSNWYGLHDLNYRLSCQRCLQTFDFPQGSFNFNNSPWRYRVIGPFSVPDYAGGGYATALTMRLFAHLLGSAHDCGITYTTGIEFTIEKKKSEIDFAVWFQRRRIMGENKEPLLIFGESKSFAEKAFKDKDILTLKTIGKTFPRAFLTVSTLKEELSAEEKERIRKLAIWGRTPDPFGQPRSPVIVLTGTELFADWRVGKEWEKRGGKHAKLAAQLSIHFDNLWNLADATQQLYLDLPPYHEWQGEYYAKKYKKLSP